MELRILGSNPAVIMCHVDKRVGAREPEERVPGAKIAMLEKMKEVDGKMGGIGSGRWGGKPTVGGGLSLHLYDLLRNGDLWLRWSTADPSTVQKQEREQVDRAAIDLTGPRRKTMVVRLLQRPRLEAPPAGGLVALRLSPRTRARLSLAASEPA